MKRERVIAYVDGFNLYFGLKDARYRRYYWLNIQAMIKNLLKLDQELVVIKYFTSRVSGQPEKAKRRIPMSTPLALLLCLALGGQDDLSPLIDAIAQVESGGNPAAIGDGGLAVGLLQIHPATVRDCNRILGRDVYALDDRLDPEKSKAMFRIIANHYSKGQSYEVIARRWNGGPKGDRKPATKKYWEKVKKILDAG